MTAIPTLLTLVVIVTPIEVGLLFPCKNESSPITYS